MLWSRDGGYIKHVKFIEVSSVVFHGVLKTTVKPVVFEYASLEVFLHRLSTSNRCQSNEKNDVRETNVSTVYFGVRYKKHWKPRRILLVLSSDFPHGSTFAWWHMHISLPGYFFKLMMYLHHDGSVALCWMCCDILLSFLHSLAALHVPKSRSHNICLCTLTLSS